MKPWASPTEVHRKYELGRIELTYTRRSKEGFMGRFGGGWQWKIGFQASEPSEHGWTIILSLLVSELRIFIKPRRPLQVDSLAWRIRDRANRIKRWFFWRCEDCGKPFVICGFRVGKHEIGDRVHIPF